MAVSEMDFTCGSDILPANHALYEKVMSCETSCADEIECIYYSADLGRKDLYSHCGLPASDVDENLRRQYKTVPPICNECQQKKIENPPCGCHTLPTNEFLQEQSHGRSKR